MRGNLSPFGWDLPPGVSHRMIEEAQIQDDDEEEVEVKPPNYAFITVEDWCVRFRCGTATGSDPIAPLSVFEVLGRTILRLSKQGVINFDIRDDRPPTVLE